MFYYELEIQLPALTFTLTPHPTRCARYGRIDICRERGTVGGCVMWRAWAQVLVMLAQRPS